MSHNAEEKYVKCFIILKNMKVWCFVTRYLWNALKCRLWADSEPEEDVSQSRSETHINSKVLKLLHMKATQTQTEWMNPPQILKVWLSARDVWTMVVKSCRFELCKRTCCSVRPTHGGECEGCKTWGSAHVGLLLKTHFLLLVVSTSVFPVVSHVSWQ